MRLPFLKKGAAPAPAPTVAPPSDSSVSNFEKPEQRSATSTPSLRHAAPNSTEDQAEKVIETTAVAEAAVLDKLSEEPEYPSGAKLAIITIALCLSVLLMALDNTIIATAIPRITDQFNSYVIFDTSGCLTRRCETSIA